MPPKIHFVHSLVETLVTCLVVIVRQVSAWHGYKRLKDHRHNVEYIDAKKSGKTKSRAAQTIVEVYTIVFAMVLAFNILAFLCFYFFAHLGYTIMSNNFALVVIMALDAPIRQRMTAEMMLITEDHQKAVLYETSLLLEEAMNASDGSERARVKSRVEKFQNALKSTDAFKQPDYICIPDELKSQDQLNMLTTMNVVS